MTASARDLIERFGLTPHVEGGAFRELYRDGQPSGVRPAHGVIYYLLDEGDVSDFHVLDADEYWLHHAGPDVEIWWIDQAGSLRIERLGMGDGAQPCALMKGGTVFGARPVAGAKGAALFSCVTVPQFTYEKYRILAKDEVLSLCPAAEDFYKGR